MSSLEKKVYTEQEISKNLQQLGRLLDGLNAFGSLQLMDYDLICSFIQSKFGFDISAVEE